MAADDSQSAISMYVRISASRASFLSSQFHRRPHASECLSTATVAVMPLRFSFGGRNRWPEQPGWITGAQCFQKAACGRYRSPFWRLQQPDWFAQHWRLRQTLYVQYEEGFYEPACCSFPLLSLATASSSAFIKSQSHCCSTKIQLEDTY